MSFMDGIYQVVGKRSNKDDDNIINYFVTIALFKRETVRYLTGHEIRVTEEDYKWAEIDDKFTFKLFVEGL